MEHCSWEEAAPTLKDSNRVPDPSTLRRWSSGLEGSQLGACVGHWLTRGGQADHQARLLPCLIPIVQILLPLRL